MSEEKIERSIGNESNHNMTESERSQIEQMKNTLKTNIAENIGVSNQDQQLNNYVNLVMENMKFQDGFLTPKNEAFDVTGEVAGKVVRLSRFGARGDDQQAITNETNEEHNAQIEEQAIQQTVSDDKDNKNVNENAQEQQWSKNEAYTIIDNLHSQQNIINEEEGQEDVSNEAQTITTPLIVENDENTQIAEQHIDHTDNEMNAYNQINQVVDQNASKQEIVEAIKDDSQLQNQDTGQNAQSIPEDAKIIDQLRSYAKQRNLRFTEDNKISYDEESQHPKFIKYLDADSELLEQIQKTQIKKQIEEMLSQILEVPCDDPKLSDYVDALVNKMQFQGEVLCLNSEIIKKSTEVNNNQLIISQFNDNIMHFSQQMPNNVQLHTIIMRIIQNPLELSQKYDVQMKFYVFNNISNKQQISGNSEQIQSYGNLLNMHQTNSLPRSYISQNSIQSYDYQFGQIHAYLRYVVGLKENDIALFLQYMNFDSNTQQFVISYPSQSVDLGIQRFDEQGDQIISFEVFKVIHDYQQRYVFEYRYYDLQGKQPLTQNILSNKQSWHKQQSSFCKMSESTPIASYKITTMRDSMHQTQSSQTTANRLAHSAPWRNISTTPTVRKVQNIHEQFEMRGISPVRKQALKRPQFCQYMIEKTVSK